MPRPKKCRQISANPVINYFKPHGIPIRLLEQVKLTIDEVEALKLADLQGLTQKMAAKEMNISRATFGRIMALAREKVADALIHGKAIRIEGGHVEIKPLTNNQSSDADVNTTHGQSIMEKPSR